MDDRSGESGARPALSCATNDDPEAGPFLTSAAVANNNDNNSNEKEQNEEKGRSQNVARSCPAERVVSAASDADCDEDIAALEAELEETNQQIEGTQVRLFAQLTALDSNDRTLGSLLGSISTQHMRAEVEFAKLKTKISGLEAQKQQLVETQREMDEVCGGKETRFQQLTQTLWQQRAQLGYNFVPVLPASTTFFFTDGGCGFDHLSLPSPVAQSPHPKDPSTLLRDIFSRESLAGTAQHRDEVSPRTDAGACRSRRAVADGTAWEKGDGHEGAAERGECGRPVLPRESSRDRSTRVEKSKFVAAALRCGGAHCEQKLRRQGRVL